MAEQNGMDIINTHIKNGEYSNVYLLGGEEKYLLLQYKDKLVSSLIDTSDTMNFEVYKGDSIDGEQIVSSCLTMPFFAERRVVLVEDSNYFKKGNVKIEEALEELPETTILIFCEDNIDKRSKLYKQVVKLGTVASFETPKESTLLVWIKSLFTKDNISIDDTTVYHLLEGVGSDMNTLYNESEKLKCYCFEKGKVDVSDVDALCVNQVEGKIFEMMDALSKRDKRTTLRLYDDLVSLREPYMRILFLITRQFNIVLKTKLAVEGNMDNGKIASVLKIPPFTVKKYVAFCKEYTYSELVKKVNMCQEADSNIKSGIMRDSLAVERLIVDLLETGK